MATHATTFKAPRALMHPSRRTVFSGVWLVASLVAGGEILASRDNREAPAAVLMLTVVLSLACTAALLRWLSRPDTTALPAATITRRGPFVWSIAATVLVTFSLGFLGVRALIPVGAAALVLLVVVQPPLVMREAVYALVLGVVATIGGLIDWQVEGGGDQLAWSVFQTPLVLLTLLAGRAIAREAGWTETGIGQWRLVAGGPRWAIRSLLVGAALSFPWTLANLVFGGYREDDVRRWWQPLGAVQPGVAEEAWARAFMIALLYLCFRRFARAEAALLTATLAGVYWFAFLHTPFNPLATLSSGAIFALPMAWLWLRRDLETAIGFHVCLDAVPFLAAYLMARGLWFT